MPTIKRSLFPLSKKIRRQDGMMKEKWTADFSRPEKSCFDIKPENSFNAYLEKGSLFLGMKKKSCMAWLETFRRVYTDQVIEARFRFGNFESYCATGIMFRISERGTGTTSGTFYLALISNKGYFRCDAVNNGVPRPLVGWTEAPGLSENGIHMNVIARDDHLIFILNGRWIAEVRDSSIPGGHLGFALVSYDSDEVTDDKETHISGDQALRSPLASERYTCQAWLDFLSVDSRTRTVGAMYEKWFSTEITAESRLRLAESFAALDHAGAAYDQILKAWKQREEAARSVTATYTEMRAKSELLLAARIVQKLGQFSVAEEYIDTYLSMGVTCAEEITALAEKTKILSALHKYSELADFLPAFINKIKDAPNQEQDLPALYALLGYVCQNIKDYETAANAWNTAFGLNRKNGLYAINAAAAYEIMEKTEEAMQCRLSGAKSFLREKNYPELGVLISKIPYDPEFFSDLDAALELSPDDKNLLDFAAAVEPDRIKNMPENEAPVQPEPPKPVDAEPAPPIPALKEEPANAGIMAKPSPEKKPAATKAKPKKAPAKTPKKAEVKKPETAVKKPAKAAAKPKTEKKKTAVKPVVKPEAKKGKTETKATVKKINRKK